MSIQLADTRDQQALARTLATISRLGLDQHLIELEMQGFTILRDVLSSDQIERARKAILDRVETMIGKRPDLETATPEDFAGKHYLHYLLYDDVVFEEILMQERPLAIVTYLLGESCKLSSVGCHFKGQGEDGAIALHADGANGLVPLPSHSLVANVNYALVPYSQEAGAAAIVPGSHKYCRQPTPAESSLTGETVNPHAIAVDLRPGDCVIWHGNTWHGSFPRQIPGIRMNTAVYFARNMMATQERHRELVPREVLERHQGDERFARLLGLRDLNGYGPEGPELDKIKFMPAGPYS